MDVLIPIRSGFICSSISADFVWEVNVAPVEQVSERTIRTYSLNGSRRRTNLRQESKFPKSSPEHFTDYFRESR